LLFLFPHEVTSVPNSERETRNIERGTRNAEHEIQNTERGTRNIEF